MIDLAEVVADAKETHKGRQVAECRPVQLWECSCGATTLSPGKRERHVNEAIVAALQQSGVLVSESGGLCGGCGARINDPADVRAGMHVIERPPSYSISHVLDADDNLVPTHTMDDPRQPCGPVYALPGVWEYKVGKLTATLQDVLESLSLRALHGPAEEWPGACMCGAPLPCAEAAMLAKIEGSLA